MDVAKCLRKLGVTPEISIDNEGKERFHPLSLMGHYLGHFPNWMYSYASNPIQKVRFHIILNFKNDIFNLKIKIK